MLNITGGRIPSFVSNIQTNKNFHKLFSPPEWKFTLVTRWVCLEGRTATQLKVCDKLPHKTLGWGLAITYCMTRCCDAITDQSPAYDRWQGRESVGWWPHSGAGVTHYWYWLHSEDRERIWEEYETWHPVYHWHCTALPVLSKWKEYLNRTQTNQ